MAHWQEISEHTTPRRGRFMGSDPNKGDKRHQKILNITPSLAVRTMASGMMAGLTSPARPWFRLTTGIPGLSESAAVKEWMFAVERLMREIFSRSNLYNVLPVIYGELGDFGTAAMILEKDFDDVIRCVPYTIGEYALANDKRLRANTLYREFPMTVDQLVDRFGEENVSPQTKNLYDNNNLDKWVEVVQAIEPNPDAKADRPEAKYKPYRSVYFEKSGNEGRFLSESGYDLFPVMAPRWDVTSTDVYGTSCPGMLALGEIKGLMHAEKMRYRSLEQVSNPPMVGPPSLKGKRTSTLPGAITYVSEVNGQQFRKAYDINPYFGEQKMTNPTKRDFSSSRLNKKD